MKVAVVGCGHVGLITGVGLAAAGHGVIAIDISEERIEAINRGQVPFYEPGLERALADVLRNGNFQASTDLQSVIEADLITICVGTPSASDGSIDLSVFREAVSQVARVLRNAQHYQVVVVRSTVVPGTTESLVWPILQQTMTSRGSPIGLAVNPEFLREGRALEDFLQTDRIVIGELDVRSGDALAKLYETFGVPIIRTNSATAEMIKYTSNALLATLISFSNEIARVCESVPGVDVEDVLNTVHLDRRLTQEVDGRRISAGINHYLKAGCGYGGSCLPKDLRALIAFARKRGVEPGLLEAVNTVNESQPIHFVNLAERWAGSLQGKRTLVLGLSFKDGTDDVRESPGITIVRNLLERGALVEINDPVVRKEQVVEVLKLGAEFVDDPISAFKGADVCFITTSAPEFKFVETVLDPTSPGTKQTIVVDGRRILSRDALAASNNYIATGIGFPDGKSHSLAGRNPQ
jgi:UDPglucose 6-dehydrogenase/GDP-mannose 6-dehydrogenase